MVYLLNAPVLTAYGTYQFLGPISSFEARKRLDGQVVSSAIGHEGTASLLSKILERSVQLQRISVQLHPGDSALVFRLLERLPEGVILSTEELESIPYELGWLQLISQGNRSPHNNFEDMPRRGLK